MQTKYFNQNYDGSGIPLPVGDRYYGQDRTRDFFNHREYGALIARSIVNRSGNTIINGGVVTQGAGHTIDITSGFGVTTFEIEVPDNWGSLPPTTTNVDIPIIVEIPALTNQSITGATTDGVTVNYVKIAYNETFTSTRARAKKPGSYASETESSYTLTVNSTAPTTYELTLARFTSNGTLITFIGSESRGVSVSSTSETIGSLKEDSGNLVLEESILLGQTIPETTVSAFSSLTASSWYFLVMREDNFAISTQIMTAFTPTSPSWTPNLTDNQLDMLPFYDINLNYPRYISGGFAYRILYVFKTNATPNNFGDNLVIKTVNKLNTNVIMTNSTNQSGVSGTGVFLLFNDIELDLLSEISGATTARLVTLKQSNTTIGNIVSSIEYDNNESTVGFYLNGNQYTATRSGDNVAGQVKISSTSMIVNSAKGDTVSARVSKLGASSISINSDTDPRSTIFTLKGID